jgi:hypothetical protein
MEIIGLLRDVHANQPRQRGGGAGSTPTGEWKTTRGSTILHPGVVIENVVESASGGGMVNIGRTDGHRGEVADWDGLLKATGSHDWLSSSGPSNVKAGTTWQGVKCVAPMHPVACRTQRHDLHQRSGLRVLSAEGLNRRM